MKKSLSPREQQICEKLLTQPGLTRRGIAQQLGISRYTVDFHLRHVYKKTGVDNRYELLAQIRQK